MDRIIATAKATVFTWACILLPLGFGFKYIEHAMEMDSNQCVDTFVYDEGVNLEKYMALQFECAKKMLEHAIAEVKNENFTKPKELAATLKSIAEQNPNIISLSVYQENGAFIACSSNNKSADLVLTNSLKSLNDKMVHEIEVLKDNSTALKYITAKNLPSVQKGKIFFQMIIKWEYFEKYMLNLEEGSFPRLLYIISPHCKRYVSLNSLPRGSASENNAKALGMHLADKIKTINDGQSFIKVDPFEFKIFKREIKLPANCDGTNFFIVIATGSEVFKSMVANMIDSLPFLMLILIASWLFLSLVISRFYNKTKDQLEIANAISDSTPMAIAIFKVDTGKIMKINQAGSTFFRVGKEEANTVNMWDLFLNAHDREYISEAVTANINISNYEVMLQSFGGATFWSICSVNPIEIEEEKFMVLAALDIHARKEAERKLANNAEFLEKQVAERTADLQSKAVELEMSNSLLESAKAAADSANSEKSKFLTNVSNEFKTPIHAIVGYAEILKEESLDRKDAVSADDLRKIIGSSKHLLSLIDEIMDLSKIEAGKTQLFFENAAISDIVTDVEGVTMPMIIDQDNSLFVEYSKDIGSMYTDTTKLRQCLLNVISNAAKFSEFGKITIKVAPMIKNEIDFVEFSITDTGTGIAPERLANIFEPFQTIKEEKGSGAGLGLSITKKYIEFLGGEVGVESTLGVGSKFMLRVPRTCTVEASEFIEIKNNQITEDVKDDKKPVETDKAVIEDKAQAVVEEKVADDDTGVTVENIDAEIIVDKDLDDGDEPAVDVGTDDDLLINKDFDDDDEDADIP